MQGVETTQVTLNKKGSFNLRHGISWIPRARTPGWPSETLKPGLCLCLSGISWTFIFPSADISFLLTGELQELRAPRSITNHLEFLSQIHIFHEGIWLVWYSLWIGFPFVKWCHQLSPDTSSLKSATMTKGSTLVGLERRQFSEKHMSWIDKLASTPRHHPTGI